MNVLRKSLHGVITSGTGNGQRVSVEFVWERQDPLIIQANYSPQAGSWVIGRDLIADGLRGKSGEGFVTVAPGPVGSGLLLTVRGEGASPLTVFFPGGITDMGIFLTATYREVSRHHNIAADLDRELARIFTDAA